MPKSITVTPSASHETTYESLTLWTGTNGANDPYNVEVRAWDGAVETSLGSISNSGAVSNAPVDFFTFDFGDFTASSATEFRIYGWGVNTPTSNPANGGIRFDDIVLNGNTVFVPEPSSAALLGLAVLGLLRRRR